MSELTCDYHPQRTAVEKCERCNRLICLEDKNTFNSNQSRGLNRYSTSIMCPLCLYEEIKKTQSGLLSNPRKMGFMISTVILVFFGGFTGLINLLTGGMTFINIFFGIFISIAVITVLLVFNFAVPKPSSDLLANAEDKKNKLLGSLDGKFMNPVSKSKSVLYCYSCGFHIDSDALYCPECGDPTTEERQEAEKPAK